jgi:septal ring-binding cell division protein DamX
VAYQLEDDGFHEIQLNGKQLVFLFMAATVVSVVIFLCGVLVGRGVRAERAPLADAAPATALAETTPQQPPLATPPTPVGSDPTAAAPPPTPATDDLSYFKRLEKPQPPSDDLKRRPAPATSAPADSVPPSAPAAAPPAIKAPLPAPKAPPPPTEAARDAAEPSGQGFVVQIAALNVRSEADAIVKRLSSKGYAAYVLTPANGMPSVYRVRVGKFNTRREAETIAAKLQKEEQLKPWVTR